jgi:hypothetical protein
MAVMPDIGGWLAADNGNAQQLLVIAGLFAAAVVLIALLAWMENRHDRRS